MLTIENKFKKEIAEFENEVRENKELNNALIQIGLNQDLIDIYLSRNKIEQFEINKLLTDKNLNFIEVNLEFFDKLKDLVSDAKELDSTITEVIKKTDRIESSLKENSKVLTPLNSDIADLKSEISKPVEEFDLKLKLKSIEELIEVRDEREKEIKASEKTRASTRKKKDEQLSAFNTAKGQTQTLKIASDTALNFFNTAKRNLEEQTELKFDKLLTREM